MKVPTIGECMTRTPHTIGEDIPLKEATHAMHEYRIRHLPVLRGGKLVGVLSDRDLKLALSVHPSAIDLKAGDVMSEGAYAVTPQTPVDQATERMSTEKYGCAIVVDDGRTVGIFTANDALRVLTTLLREQPARKIA